jgi:hypothetical protein
MVTTESALVFIDTTPTSPPATPARIVPVSIPKTLGQTLIATAPAPQKTVKPKNQSENELVSLFTKSMEQVPPVGWFGATALLLGVASLRRLIRR